jgi:hypothetical protein
MNCEECLEAVSAYADGELTDEAAIAEMEEHLADCASCSDFRATVDQIRSGLRFDSLDDVPDLPMPDLPDLPERGNVVLLAPEDRSPLRSSGARTRRRSSRPMWIAAAAAAIVGMVGGAAFVSLGNEATPDAAADFADQILRAQAGITAVDGEFVLTEYGNSDTSGTNDQRRFDGELVYEAPESLRLTLKESDTAPGTIAAGDVDLVADDSTWTLDQVRTCQCPDTGGVEPWRQAVADREPFSESATTPLELVTAVDGFALASEPIALDARTVAGAPALGVQVTAGQISGFLSALSPANDLRAVHPTDQVDIWFERDHLVPVLVEVHAADNAERREWARAKGYDHDEAGKTVLRYEMSSLTVNGADPSDDFQPDTDPPADPQETSEGFQTGDPAFVPQPQRLPKGVEPHLAGTVSTPGGPTVGVRTWTDGRAWVKVRATEQWDGSRVFGDLGPAAHPIDLGNAGTAYTDGHKVAVHADGLDLVVSGSVSTEQLRAAAASLGVIGQQIPETWPEAATATIEEAATMVPDLVVPHGLDGFEPPAVRIADGQVTQVYTGPGERGFVLTQTAGDELSPPAGAKNLGVEVRGTTGRYVFDRGELEWIEDGTAYGLSSSTLSLAELIDIAEGLGPR